MKTLSFTVSPITIVAELIFVDVPVKVCIPVHVTGESPSKTPEPPASKSSTVPVSFFIFRTSSAVSKYRIA